MGASTEAEEHDDVVRSALEDEGIEYIAWRHSFRPGEYGLDSLARIVSESDAAILIASPDDRTWYRGQDTFTPRDNVLFELGYFIQAFGRRRTAIVQVENERGVVPRVPTDLAGLTTIQFRHDSADENGDKVRRWAAQFKATYQPRSRLVEEILELLRADYPRVDPSWLRHLEDLVLTPVLRQIAAPMRGEIQLTPGQYYTELENEIRTAAQGTTILAVSTVSSQVWASDRDQQNYFERNLEAVTRGAQIRRLFVLPPGSNVDLVRTIEAQVAAGVHVRVTNPEFLAYFNALEDIVVFMNKGQPPIARAYVGLPSFDNPTRIRGGRLILDHRLCQNYVDDFEEAWRLARPPEKQPVKGTLLRTRTRPPGERMQVHRTSTPVITCTEAAVVRGVPLEKELKTLILNTSSGYMAAHVQGHRRVSLPKLKVALESEQASLASLEELKALGLSPGTVSAVLNPVWSLPHLVDRGVMDVDVLTTNNGTLTGYFMFKPEVLLQAPSATVDDLAELMDGEPDPELADEDDQYR